MKTACIAVVELVRGFGQDGTKGQWRRRRRGERGGKAPDGSGPAPAEAGRDAAVEARALVPAKRTLELSRDDFRKIGDRQRNRRANAIGKIVSLLARSTRYRDMPVSDLDWFLMPAIAAGQYLIGETKPSAERRGGVVAMLLWARVSPEVDKRLSESKDKPPRLKPEEWTSGDIVRVIEVVGRKDAIKPLLAEFGTLSRSRTRTKQQDEGTDTRGLRDWRYLSHDLIEPARLADTRCKCLAPGRSPARGALAPPDLWRDMGFGG